MLRKPCFGWTEVRMQDWHRRASYLTDIPHDFLDAFNRLFKTQKPQCVYCDAEGWDYIIVFSFNEVQIIESKENNKLYSMDVDICSLTEELIKDLESNLDLWVRWSDLYDIENEIEIVKETKKILSKIQQLKINLKRRQQ